MFEYTVICNFVTRTVDKRQQFVMFIDNRDKDDLRAALIFRIQTKSDPQNDLLTLIPDQNCIILFCSRNNCIIIVFYWFRKYSEGGLLHKRRIYLRDSGFCLYTQFNRLCLMNNMYSLKRTNHFLYTVQSLRVESFH